MKLYSLKILTSIFFFVLTCYILIEFLIYYTYMLLPNIYNSFIIGWVLFILLGRFKFDPIRITVAKILIIAKLIFVICR